jgi:hypothetical protein
MLPGSKMPRNADLEAARDEQYRFKKGLAARTALIFTPSNFQDGTFQIGLLDTSSSCLGAGLSKQAPELLDFGRNNRLENYRISFANDNELIAFLQPKIVTDLLGNNDLPL